MNIILVMGLFAAGILAASAVHQKRLARARGIPRETFVQALSSEGLSAEIAGTIYDYYQSQSSTASFQVSPDFSLRNVFRRSHEDVDDDAQSILAELGLQLPEEQVLREWTVPLGTVRDMARWVQWVKDKQAPVRKSNG
jgi:hypothetical protein